MYDYCAAIGTAQLTGVNVSRALGRRPMLRMASSGLMEKSEGTDELSRPLVDSSTIDH